MMRKRFKSTMALGAISLLVGATLVGCASSDNGGEADAKPLTLVTWGGTTEEGFKAAFADPFTEETGIPTEMVNPVDYGKYSAQIESDKVTWDWVDLEGWFTVQNPDWWAPVDTSIVKADKADFVTLPGQEVNDADWVLPGMSYSFVISNKADTDKKVPATWAEFFDTTNFPGKRAVYNYPYGMLEIALLADGVAYEDLYPLDIDRALTKLETIRGDLVFWNSGAEMQQKLTSGEADFVVAWNNRVKALADAGEKVEIQWNENLQDGGYTVTAKANPQLKETMQLFAAMMTTDAQVKAAEATGYSPALKSAVDALPADSLSWYSAAPENQEQAVGSINLQWWAENFDVAVEKWTAWAGQ